MLYFITLLIMLTSFVVGFVWPLCEVSPLDVFPSCDVMCLPACLGWSLGHVFLQGFPFLLAIDFLRLVGFVAKFVF